MVKDEVIEILEKYALHIKPKFPVKMVILLPAYLSDREDIFETVIVMENLVQDLLEAREDLIKMAGEIDPRIEPTIVEADRKDPTGFFDEIQKKGVIIYWEM